MLLVLNAGSQSLKYALYEMPKLKLAGRGEVEHIFPGGDCHSHGEALAKIKEEIGRVNIEIVGHRVVHGGVKLRDPAVITKGVLKEIKLNSELAPLHNPVEVEVITEAARRFRKAKQVAVFDTGFYKRLPDVTKFYGIPRGLTKRFKIERLGFHGISHEYAAKKACRDLKKKFSKTNIISCHLGGGSSITAIQKGRAIDTSMGFTPAEGLMMMTRSGDVDPGLVFYLERKTKYGLIEIEKMLTEKSGVFGVSGISRSMKEVLVAYKRGDKKAKLAVDMFFYRIKKYIGAYETVLGKVDLIVFTGSIGARQKGLIKREVLSGMRCLKGVPSYFTETDEESMIARKVLGLKLL